MNEQSNESFLIILPRQLGDVILATPLVEALRKVYPGARIYWVACAMAREVLTDLPGLTEAFFLPKAPKNRAIMAWLAYWWAEFAFVWQIRKLRIDVSIDVMASPRTALLGFLSGARIRVGMCTRWIRQIAYNRVIDRGRLGDYLAGSRLAFLEPLGISRDVIQGIPDTRIPRGDVDRRRIDDLLASWKLKEQHFVLMSPTHRRAARQWPREYYVDLAVRLWREHGWATVWLWGPGEEGFAREAHVAVVRSLNVEESSFFPPLLTIRETAELSSRALIWIGNTNGLSHVAVAGGARTVQIHGPTQWQSWTHPDQRRHRAVTRGMGCLACERNSCSQTRRECLLDLSVDTVYEAAMSLVNTNNLR